MTKITGGVAVAIFILATASDLQAQFDPPAGYYNSATGTGAVLKANLNAIIDGHVSISYSNRETGVETLDQDPTISANCLQLYSGFTVAKSQFPSGTANTEHCWPNSLGIDDANPAYGDFFNLRVCDAQVNSVRGNKYYDDVGGSTPAHADAPLCRTDATRFEPRALDKGDLARAMFYMDVRYEGDATDGFPRNLQLTDDIASITTTNNNMGRLSTLIDWHFRDPVSIEERQRNHMIYSGCGYGAGSLQNCQQNRNPFVDRPEFVWAVFGQAPNNASLFFQGTTPINGASQLFLELPTVIRGAPLWSRSPFRSTRPAPIPPPTK
ncbi:MAG: endonuclease [Planctomycetes bacterium]|nr:endonuclease [Planctomycetota bacterium]